MIFSHFNFKEVENYVDYLDSADKLIISAMVLEGAIFSLILIKIELIVAYDKTSEEEVEEQSGRHQQMEVLESDIGRFNQLFAVIFL